MISKIHFIFVIYRLFFILNSCCHAWSGSCMFFLKSFQKNSFKNSFNTPCKTPSTLLANISFNTTHPTSTAKKNRRMAKTPICISAVQPHESLQNSQSCSAYKKKPLSTRKNRRAGPKTSLVPAAL